VFHYCRAIGAAPPASMIGRTSIGQLIALVGRAKAHLGGDTGSTHIAAALGVPAIGLYSVTRPERVCPYGQRERTHYDPEGLDRIHPKAVLNTLLQAIRA
jgi:ADP-heptose:LPS heptosyltransferase